MESAICEPATHDYTRRCWGHDYIFKPIDDGMRGEVTGWGFGLSDGDYLLLQNEGGSTRYRIEQVEYIGGQGGPHDMWKAQVVFAPRSMRSGMSLLGSPASRHRSTTPT